MPTRSPVPFEIPADALDPVIDLSALAGATSTAEIAPQHAHVGQERALRSLRLGVRLRAPGYNVYVAGLMGSGKQRHLAELVRAAAPDLPSPPDRVLVWNFDDPGRPVALTLPPGAGRSLRLGVSGLLMQLRRILPESLHADGFEQEKEVLSREYQGEIERLQAELAALAAEDPEPGWTPPAAPEAKTGFLEAQRADAGGPRVPAGRGEELEPEVASRLATTLTRRGREVLESLGRDVEAAVRRHLAGVVEPLFVALEAQCPHAACREYLLRLRRYTLAHLGRFGRADPDAGAGEPDPYLEFRVNLLVDHAETAGAPVAVEESPSARNLFGSLENAVDEAGRSVPDFTRIKAGSLLRASGGYLVVDLEDAVTETSVWRRLKRALRHGRLEMDHGDSPFGAAGPELAPLPVDVRVVGYGTVEFFERLRAADPDFGELFKVVAEFEHDAALDPEAVLGYARRLSQVARSEGFPHFEAAAVREIVWFGCRHVEHRERVEAVLDHVDGLAREAGHLAAEEGAALTTGLHVRRAVQDRRHRDGRLEEKTRGRISEGTVLLEVVGRRVGQVNALVVVGAGDHAFGAPVRVTASVGPGRGGVVSVDREARLSGPTHAKGTLILAGYLRSRFGRERPVALSASVAFEQSYAGVDGDSASSAELCALLSRIAGLPLRQDLAVTGSVSQGGQIQAVGGVNEKIEGFYRVCRAAGLTGSQGVILPTANRRHLVLAPEVVQAVREGVFHLFAVSTADQAMELLCGLPAGAPGEPGTVNGRVGEGLRELGEAGDR